MTVLAGHWLTSRPIAHRGLHDRAQGVIENSFAAASAAIAGGYAIECDIQIAADGEAMVFHDDALDRLTAATGPVEARAATALQRIALTDGGETIPTLGDFLARVAGRTPVIVEIKSRFNGATRLAERAAEILAAYAGPAALKSFDPAIMAYLRTHKTRLGIANAPLGMVAEARYDDPEWDFLGAERKQALANFLHWDDTRPDFLSYAVMDLPNGVPHLLRRALGLPLMAWTVRTPQQRAIADQWADQIIFEGWRP